MPLDPRWTKWESAGWEHTTHWNPNYLCFCARAWRIQGKPCRLEGHFTRTKNLVEAADSAEEAEERLLRRLAEEEMR
jgi:hypothetical protein